MTLTAVILIIISAFMHAAWNLIGKRQQASLAFFSIAALAAALLASPALLLYRHALPQIPPAVWLLLPATGFAQAVYFYGLTAAYRQGDISLVYPLARAIPILMVVALSFILGKGDAITPTALAGMLLVVAGCVILPLPTFKQFQPEHYANIVYILVLITAVGTTGYTLLDDEILRQLRQAPAILLTDSEVTLLFIPFQAGITLLKEPRYKPKLLGILIISTGLILVGIG